MTDKQYAEGYTYIFKADNGFYKIGYSKQIPERIRYFGIVLPYDLQPIIFYGCREYKDLEKQLHKIFAHRRVKGEWFNLSSFDLDWLITDAGSMADVIVLNGNVDYSNLPYKGCLYA